VHPRLELLDTPGILPPVSFSKEVTSKLAMLNLIPDYSYDVLEIAEEALIMLRSRYPDRLDGYVSGLSSSGNGLIDIAFSRNLLMSGAKPDTNRAAVTFLKELRDGRLGRITLDP
jgi:ribosome biogenesis GTPase A